MKKIIKFLILVILMMFVCYIFEWAILQSIITMERKTMEKTKIYNYEPEIRKDIFDSLKDQFLNYDFEWLLDYIRENFTPEEIFGDEYMAEWFEKECQEYR